MKIATQTPRWCQLATTLWSLIVLDSQRSADRAGLAQFLEVISWRATGKITEEEFSILYAEWMLTPEAPAAATTSSKHLPTSPTKAKKTILGVGVMRSLLIERACPESDLDLFIGMIIHEANIRLLNSTISYVNNKVNKNLPSFSLEVVTPKWLALSEELFFSLDTPGYGVWRFDEAMFFCACVAVGLQGWKNEGELESDLSIATLSTMALQFMRDAGAYLTLSSARNLATDPREMNRPWVRQKAVASHPKQEVTLVMFKKYLIRRNVGENELTLMVQHLKFCIERVVRLVKMNGADDFYMSFQPLEHRGSIIGSPRMWQEAVMVAAGLSNSVLPQPIPPVLLYLLTDAEKYITGSFRAVEFLIDGSSFIDATDSTSHLFSTNQSNVITNPLLSHLAANDELHENTYKLWNHFQKWGRDEAPALTSLSSGLKKNSSELQRDPVYQLILNALLQYKRLQQVLNAAMFDFSISQYGTCPVNGNAVMVGNLAPPNPLSILCAGLTPNNRKVLAELGLMDNFGEIGNDEIDAERLTRDDTESNMDNNDLLADRISEAQFLKHNQSEVDDEVPTLEEPVEILYENPNEKKFKKISELPLANRRKNLLESKASNSTPPTSSNKDRNLASLEKQKQKNTETNMPNYFKPTLTYLAKKPSKSELLEGAESSGEQSVPTSNSSTLPKSAKKSAPIIPSATYPPAAPMRDPNQPDWVNMLDFRNKASSSTAPIQTSQSSFKSGIPLRAQPLISKHNSNSPKATETMEMKQKEKDPGSLTLNEQEAQILSKLLVVNDPQEQARLVEQLRQLKLGLSIPNPPNTPANKPTSRPSSSSNSIPLTSAALSQHELQEKSKLQQSNYFHDPRKNQLSPTGSELLMTQLNEEAYHEAMQETMSDRSSVAPSSIQELLQQGQSPGRYAQMLRDILRKMSKDDSHVKLKSLEQIIKLGENIVQESEEKKKVVRSVSPNPNQIGRKSLPQPAPSTERRSRSANPMRRSELASTPVQPPQEDNYIPSFSPNSPNPMTISALESSSNMKTIQRAKKVPGLQPDTVVKKTKKAFGHPIEG